MQICRWQLQHSCDYMYPSLRVVFLWLFFACHTILFACDTYFNLCPSHIIVILILVLQEQLISRIHPARTDLHARTCKICARVARSSKILQIARIGHWNLASFLLARQDVCKIVYFFQESCSKWKILHSNEHLQDRHTTSCNIQPCKY